MALPALLFNAAVSIGLQLVSSWLFPKPAAKISDETPQLDTGTPMYFCWGEMCFCPGHLLYALTTAQAGTTDKYSAYANLGLANPSGTSLLALRVNGYILSTKSSSFPIATPDVLGLSNAKSKAGKKGKSQSTGQSSDTYVNAYGLTTYVEVDYKVQFEFRVDNPDFNTLGYGDLRYLGLTWLALRGRRNLVGLPASRQVWYISNSVNDITAATQLYVVDGSANDPAVISVSLFYGLSRPSVDFNFAIQNGIRGLIAIACFESPTMGSTKNDLLVLSNGYAKIVRYDVRPLNINYQLVGTPTAINRNKIDSIYQGTQGSLNTANIPIVVSTITVGTLDGNLEEVQLTSSRTAPFRSFNGVVYDSNNIAIANIGIGKKLYGWGGGTYIDFSFNSAGVNYTAKEVLYETIPINGDSFGLSRIIRHLLALRGVNSSDIIFMPGFNEAVLGFTCTAENVSDTIINLCTSFNKFCYVTRSGKYKFMPYPVVTTPAMVITPDRLTAPPKIEILDESSLPQAVELTFRNTAKELSEDTITVGNTASVYRNKARLNCSLNSIEATAIGYNILNLVKNTYLKVELMVDTSAQPLEPGDVIDFSFYPGTPLRLMISNAEYGQDLTVKLTCVNYVGASSRTLGQIPTFISLPAIPIPPVIDNLAYIHAETRSANASLITGGNLLYTTSASPYGTTSGNPPRTDARMAVAGLYQGFLIGIGAIGTDIRYGLTNITIANTRDRQTIPASGEIRVGNSWVGYKTATPGADNTVVLSDVTTGLYGSNWRIAIEDKCYVSGNNPIGDIYPDVFPSVSQGSTTILSETFNRGRADRTYGLPIVSFSISSGKLQIWYGKVGSRSTDFVRLKTQGQADFARSIWLVNTANNQFVEIGYNPAILYHEQLLTAIAYSKGDVFELVENKTIGATVYAAPTYGAWVNSAVAV